MTVTTVEGHATVTANGVTRTAVAGSSVQIKLDEDMNPVSSPSLPQAYAMEDVASLPRGATLGRKISIHMPLTAAEIATVQHEQSAPVCPANCHLIPVRIMETAAATNVPAIAVTTEPITEMAIVTTARAIAATMEATITTGTVATMVMRVGTEMATETGKTADRVLR